MTYKVKAKMSAITKEGDFVTLDSGELLIYSRQERGWITAIRDRTQREVSFHIQRIAEGKVTESNA